MWYINYAAKIVTLLILDVETVKGKDFRVTTSIGIPLHSP